MEFVFVHFYVIAVSLMGIFCGLTTVFVRGNCEYAGSACKWIAVKCRVGSKFITLLQTTRMFYTYTSRYGNFHWCTCVYQRQVLHEHTSTNIEHTHTQACNRTPDAQAHALYSCSLCLFISTNCTERSAMRLDFKFHGPR